MKRKVIAITDGDPVAERAAQEIAKKVGGRFISQSAGNPTPLSDEELVELVKQTPKDPVIVLFDDRGHHGVGQGEAALAYLARHPDIQLLGVVAVASNIKGAKGTPVDFSITSEGEAVPGPVDKEGKPTDNPVLVGDTVKVLSELTVPLVVGTGDTGKMAGKDLREDGSPITLKAVEAILNNSINQDKDEVE